ncbi:MAG: hypothetical protein WAR37_00455 [Candidatus Microsaccharimonas sp.]
MTSRADTENGTFLSREDLLADIAARTRGYARELAVVAVTPYVLYGVYKLPDQPHFVHAVIDRSSDDLGDLSSLSFTRKPDIPITPEIPRGLTLSAAHESQKPDGLMLFNAFIDDPLYDENSLPTHMARRIMTWFREFDKKIPYIEPSNDTETELYLRDMRIEADGTAYLRRNNIQ